PRPQLAVVDRTRTHRAVRWERSPSRVLCNQRARSRPEPAASRSTYAGCSHHSARDAPIRGRKRPVAFWFLWSVDALTALIAVYFFFVGLADGTVSSFNIGIWTVLLLGLGGVVLGSLALRAAGREAWARAVVVALAVPALGVGLFFAVLLGTHPRWN